MFGREENLFYSDNQLSEVDRLLSYLKEYTTILYPQGDNKP